MAGMVGALIKLAATETKSLAYLKQHSYRLSQNRHPLTLFLPAAPSPLKSESGRTESARELGEGESNLYLDREEERLCLWGALPLGEKQREHPWLGGLARYIGYISLLVKAIAMSYFIQTAMHMQPWQMAYEV